jgi:hypothetical protein
MEGSLMIRHFFAAHLGLLWELSGALAAFGVVIVVAGVLTSRFDKIPLGEGIYYAFITAFTVGFGDVAPKSHGARVVAIILAFMGLILVGIVVAVAVHSLDLALQAAPGA